jgi:hypothetical protein
VEQPLRHEIEASQAGPWRCGLLALRQQHVFLEWQHDDDLAGAKDAAIGNASCRLQKTSKAEQIIFCATTLGKDRLMEWRL